jgi:release factor glutamine methyltransferase
MIKKIINPIIKYWFNLYYSKPRLFSYQNLEVVVKPGVFPPHFTISTKLMLDFIKPLNLKEKSFLELGCGSGIISLLAASKGAIVTATDINKMALDGLTEASEKYNYNISIIYSDLFNNIKQTNFDYIIINPPYYPKNPKSINEQAWFCGENFEYFYKLFKKLPDYLNSKNEVFMILSEDCDINNIKKIATKTDIRFQLIQKKTKGFEKNYIFKITKGL